jgi:YegS/Rv2252/BmrU family lipid kinase
MRRENQMDNRLDRVKLIANPGSGKPSGKPVLLDRVVKLLMAQGIQVDVALAIPNKMAVPIAKQAVKDGYKTVIALGGDDTIQAVIRGIAGTKTILGIIPAGTEDNVALSLAIPEQVEQACELIINGHAAKIDLGQVKINRQKYYFFEAVTIGLAAAVYPSVKEIPRGDISSLKDASLTLLLHEAKPNVTLELDGEGKIETETMLVTVTNIPYIGLKFLAAPDASMQDGFLDISIYPEFSKAELLTYFGRVMNGGLAGDGKIQRFKAHKLKVKTVPALEVMADGLRLGSGNVKIKVIPGALRVIVPEALVKAADPQKESSLLAPVSLSPAAG